MASSSFSKPYTCRSKLWPRKEIDRNALLYIVHGFCPESEKFDSGEKRYHRKGDLKRSRMAQISASYHLPVRSYRCAKKLIEMPYYIYGFRPESEKCFWGFMNLKGAQILHFYSRHTHVCTVRVNEKLTFPHRPVSVVRKRYGSGTTYVRNRYANYACTVYGVRTESVRLRVHSLLSTEIVLRKLPSYFRMYLCASCKSNYGCVRKQLSIATTAIATTAIVTYSYCKHALVASVVSSRQNSFSC